MGFEEHSSINELLHELSRRHDFPALVERANAFLREEEEARHAFWEKANANTHAEWIMGEGIMHSPIMGRHSSAQMNVLLPLLQAVKTAGFGTARVEPVTLRCGRNDFQPDIAYWKSASKVRSDESIHPAPDFVIEILSKGTEHIDRGIKMTSYAECGVQEYWLIDPHTEIVEVYHNDAGFFYPKGKFGSGEVESQAIPGFKIKVLDIFKGV